MPMNQCNGNADEDSEDEYPEVVELDEPPEGSVCQDRDGVQIGIGDTVKIQYDHLGTEREFVVNTIVYQGFEDRAQAEIWAEPGYMVDDGETGFVHASDCRKIS